MQNYVYPSSSSISLVAEGANGAPIPSESILVAGEGPTGNLTPLQTDASGHLIVTPAAGSTGDVNLVKVGGSAIAIGQAAMATSLPVVIASNQSAVPVSAASLPLPTGAATSANQATVLARLSGSLVPTAFDEIALTYVSSGPGTGQIQTAVYKLATATVKTLTLSYDGSDRLSDVIAS